MAHDSISQMIKVKLEDCIQYEVSVLSLKWPQFWYHKLIYSSKSMLNICY